MAAHQARGPTTEEFSGAWDALDAHDTVKIHPRVDGPVGDIVGTGSDSLKTVNASTPAALIAAACGLPVAKKGARLVTGVSGASDVLERLGVDLEAPMARAEACLEAHGIGYLPGEAFLRSGWARLIQRMRFTSAFNIVVRVRSNPSSSGPPDGSPCGCSRQAEAAGACQWYGRSSSIRLT
ncbi:anthranilate phosphoribosyltransferase, partial [Halorhodospira halophila]|uniref:anthranilate phosphoribosyltransferase n=1 Tax=Halorhodospira halophila TaxID=1053 RepID=UPI003D366D23